MNRKMVLHKTLQPQQTNLDTNEIFAFVENAQRRMTLYNMGQCPIWERSPLRQMGCSSPKEYLIRGHFGPMGNLQLSFTLLAAYLFWHYSYLSPGGSMLQNALSILGSAYCESSGNAVELSRQK
ncbi:hypothetical protein OUZ56_018817 [Daphnia magna]|uniref:Uncharacterized protein n=1 Tax=Daphnia magna TaxID=35525 RepID=A0ABQ9Z9X0_9CRUS|nr:hypothetical protein OUZ56_018817 [Daphnia magna]